MEVNTYRPNIFEAVGTALKEAGVTSEQALFYGGAIPFEATLQPSDSLPISWHRGAIGICEDLGLEKPATESYKAMQIATHAVLSFRGSLRREVEHV